MSRESPRTVQELKEHIWQDNPRTCLFMACVVGAMVGMSIAGPSANWHGRSQGREAAKEEFQQKAVQYGYGEYVVANPPDGHGDGTIEFRWRCIDDGKVRGWKRPTP